MVESNYTLVPSDDDPEVAYLRLAEDSTVENRRVVRQIRLHDLIGSYEGPDVYLDFDESNQLIGIELI